MLGRRKNTVQATVSARAIYDRTAWSYVNVTLSYDPSDPYALVFDFEGITWTFARELLIPVLRTDAENTEPSGFGDVCFWRANGDFVMMRVSSPDGTGLIRFEAKELRQFVRQTFIPVPRGSEHDELNMDDVIARLLRGR